MFPLSEMAFTSHLQLYIIVFGLGILRGSSKFNILNKSCDDNLNTFYISDMAFTCNRGHIYTDTAAQCIL